MLSIRAISKSEIRQMRRVCDKDTACEHDEASLFPLGREGLKPGRYLPGKMGHSFPFEDQYSSYSRFFDELYSMVYGIDARGIWRQYRRYTGKPFAEFLEVPFVSQGETIGPKTCAKLYGDFDVNLVPYDAFANSPCRHIAKRKTVRSELAKMDLSEGFR